MSVHESAKTALRALLDEAEARDYNPPANPIAVAELEWIIAQHTDDNLDDFTSLDCWTRCF